MVLLYIDIYLSNNSKFTIKHTPHPQNILQKVYNETHPTSKLYNVLWNHLHLQNMNGMRLIPTAKTLQLPWNNTHLNNITGLKWKPPHLQNLNMSVMKPTHSFRTSLISHKTHTHLNLTSLPWNQPTAKSTTYNE